jgi:LacI family transcriptional regulator
MKKVFLYYEVSEKIKTYILSNGLRVNSFLPSERNLAKKFNVAYVTLRKSLECLVQEKILLKIPREGNKIISLPKKEDTFPLKLKKKIGLTIWNESGMEHPGYLKFISALGKEFQSTEYEIVIIYVTREMIERDYWDSFLERINELAGIIVSVQEIPEKILKKIQNLNVPTLFLNMENFTPGVWFNEMPGMTKLLDYFFSLRHERIAFITGDPSLSLVQRQIRDFKKSYEKKDIRFSTSKYIITACYEERSAYLATLKALEMNEPPSAILFGDEIMAMGGLQAINIKGLKCPEDISIASIEGAFISEHLNPPLTVLTTNLDYLSNGMRILRKIIDNGTQDTEYAGIFQRELVIRNSTNAYQDKNHMPRQVLAEGCLV